MFTLIVLAAGGRVEASDAVSLQLYAACFKDALDNGHVEQAGKNIVFTCHAPAEAFFKALGSIGVETLDEGNRRRGVFRTRYMKPPKGDRCYEQTAAVGGGRMSAFACQLFFPAGIVLKR